ncbi:peptide/nickel transport system ATP-binding protein [Jezberella montanilacus]|uniref:Peptide/nickel transport system ATP-binding protein n=1 Tax=Jezberella montanilacus TaxID=323426 RepID=A0A2T0XGC8_9BURK|nr:oligopeptide/dipeptide ABC transporter ATP-binding protein [Jezberella montanilacus]PRY97940.1 peptide/nickel transport system ATP-binding protein [Jezberella montanilacus]
MTSLLRVNQLCKAYLINKSSGWFGHKQTLHAVDGVSFELSAGETLGLVGESGCGKSTTANLVLGLLAPSSGEVVFDDQPVHAQKNATWRAARKQMQMVYQDPLGALDRRLRVIDQVIEPLDIQNILDRASRREAALAIMTAVGLSQNLFERYPHELSGGQRQRVVLARALILKPKLIVCDEPISALDVSIQAQVINLLQDIQKQMNLAMLFISHDLKVVNHICDRVAVMYLGKIVEQGPVTKVFTRPAHPYTQALLSAVASPFKPDATDRIILEGEPPNPVNRPSGCAFHPRCSKASEICKQASPRLGQITDAHQVSCHLYPLTTVEASPC